MVCKDKIFLHHVNIMNRNQTLFCKLINFDNDILGKEIYNKLNLIKHSDIFLNNKNRINFNKIVNSVYEMNNYEFFLFNLVCDEFIKNVNDLINI